MPASAASFPNVTNVKVLKPHFVAHSWDDGPMNTVTVARKPIALHSGSLKKKCQFEFKKVFKVFQILNVSKETFKEYDLQLQIIYLFHYHEGQIASNLTIYEMLQRIRKADNYVC